MSKIIFIVGLLCLTLSCVSKGDDFNEKDFDQEDMKRQIQEMMAKNKMGKDLDSVAGDDDDDDDDDDSPTTKIPKMDKILDKTTEGKNTNPGSLELEEQAIKIDELNTAQLKELRASAPKQQFQTEVNRMMKLIINSLYKNKEIFLRELISNASDALDKLRLNSITDPSLLAPTANMDIRIRIDKENKYLHITDTGIGMTKDELVKNLGTIAKSGTSDFLNQMQQKEATGEEQASSDLIGQFGVGFYSSFLVADKVIVTSKSQEDPLQHIWESDSAAFNIIEDPRGPTLQRGTQITLALKQEALNYLEESTVRDLIKKYSQFINFPIYLWTEKTVEEEVPIEEDEKDKAEKKEDKTDDDEDDDAKVEESADEDKPKTKKVSKTVYDWELINNSKPIWLRKPAEIEEKEYNEFYKTLTKDSSDPMGNTHFVAEGEVTFKSLLYIPSVQPSESFNRYGTKTDNIKLYVRRVFITDDFADIIPPYLNFLRGVVDSDDLPLNVSRENLQQSKLMKIIRKKLIRKTLDMIKKLSPEQFDKFWKEYSTNIKLGVIEDTSNRSRLSKLLKFHSSQGGITNLADYITRMKDKQEGIYYIAGASMDEVKKSPFTEKLLKRNYEVLYLTEPIDEYCINSIADFEGKKFQNVAKEGLTMKTNEEKLKELKTIYEPLTKWFTDNSLKDQILKAELSDRLETSPVALVTSRYGWTGNMERIISSQTHSKSDDVSRQYYMNQKKTLEVNPRHPLIKELLRRVKDDVEDPVAKQMSALLFHTATLRSGYTVKDTDTFINSIESMMRGSLGIPVDEEVEEDDMEEPTEEEKEKSDEGSEDAEADAEEEEKSEGGEEEKSDEDSEPSPVDFEGEEDAEHDHDHMHEEL